MVIGGRHGISSQNLIYRVSDFSLEASSESLPLLERSRGRPLTAGGGEALSARLPAARGWREGGAALLEWEPAGELLLATRWSRAFNAMALQFKVS